MMYHSLHHHKQIRLPKSAKILHMPAFLEKRAYSQYSTSSNSPSPLQWNFKTSTNLLILHNNKEA